MKNGWKRLQIQSKPKITIGNEFLFFIGSQTDWKQSADILSLSFCLIFFHPRVHTHTTPHSLQRGIFMLFLCSPQGQFYYCIFLSARPRPDVESTDPKTTQISNQPQLHTLSCAHHRKRCCSVPAQSCIFLRGCCSKDTAPWIRCNVQKNSDMTPTPTNPNGVHKAPRATWSCLSATHQTKNFLTCFFQFIEMCSLVLANKPSNIFSMVFCNSAF